MCTYAFVGLFFFIDFCTGVLSVVDVFGGIPFQGEYSLGNVGEAAMSSSSYIDKGNSTRKGLSSTGCGVSSSPKHGVRVGVIEEHAGELVVFVPEVRVTLILSMSESHSKIVGRKFFIDNRWGRQWRHRRLTICHGLLTMVPHQTPLHNPKRVWGYGGAWISASSYVGPLPAEPSKEKPGYKCTKKIKYMEEQFFVNLVYPLLDRTDERVDCRHRCCYSILFFVCVFFSNLLFLVLFFVFKSLDRDSLAKSCLVFHL